MHVNYWFFDKATGRKEKQRLSVNPRKQHSYRIEEAAKLLRERLGIVFMDRLRFMHFSVIE